MGAFLVDHGFELLFGILSTILGIIALRYSIKEHRARTEGIIDESEQVQLYLTREAMLKGLREMYESADPGDTIWGQCVGCRGYSNDVRAVVLAAASRGVRFKVLLNAASPTKDDLRAVFAPLRTAEIREAMDNDIRIQGLSNKEVIVAFPTANSYPAICIRERHFLSVMKNFFDKRWASVSDSSPVNMHGTSQ